MSGLVRNVRAVSTRSDSGSTASGPAPYSGRLPSLTPRHEAVAKDRHGRESARSQGGGRDTSSAMRPKR